MRDEELQNGVIHILSTLVRKVLICGARLGLLTRSGSAYASVPRSSSRRENSHSGLMSSLNESVDYDIDHDSSCPSIIPLAIAHAIVGLIDVCCGPDTVSVDHYLPSVAICNPCRGLLRVRRASDLALTTLFGIAMDFDLLGNDPAGAAPILKAITSRYCQVDFTSMPQCQAVSFIGEDYGYLLRKQINLQYFLDCIRIRFDNLLVSPNGLVEQGLATASTSSSVELVASSLSDILYTMLLSTLTSAAGISVSRGERDIGALVGV